MTRNRSAELRHMQTGNKPIPHTVHIAISEPQFGRAIARCECGANIDCWTNAEAPPVGRPPKKRTARQDAEEWALQHAEREHPNATLQIREGETT